MAKAKRVRWECPSGEHPGVLGSSRPRAEATVRFCLACSEAEGMLVRRTAPALERQRAAKTAVRESKAQEARRRAREAAAAALRVEVIDYGSNDHLTGHIALDAGELLKAAWASETLKAARVDARMPWMKTAPQLTIRRGDPSKGRAARPVMDDGRESGRERDTMSGHAKHGSGAIVLTIAPGLGREWLEAIVVHEAVHSALPDGEAHGRTWRSTYIRAMRELYGVQVLNRGPKAQPAWRLDEEITLALRELGRSAS